MGIRKSVTFYDDQYKFWKSFNSPNLFLAFAEYMFENIEPKGLTEQEKVLFESLRTRMDNQKKKASAGASSHGGGRPPKTTKKTTEKQQKNNKKTTEGTTKKQEDKEISKDILRDISNDISKDKEEDKVLSLSKDKEEEKSSYGDEEINECLEIIKSYNNGIINGSNQKGRQYSKHLISKLKKIENVKDGKIRRQDVLKIILEVGKENEYYSVKTTSPELIYYNLSTLMEVCRKQFKKQQGQKVLTAL